MISFFIFSVNALIGKITEDNINETLSSEAHVPVLMAIVSPWCGHCLEMKPEWELLKKKYEKNENIIIATMDLESNRPLVKRFPEFSGTPSIFWIQTTPEQAIHYSGGHLFADFDLYIERKLLPIIVPINSHQELTNKLLQSDSFSVFVLQGEISNETKSNLESIVTQLDSFPFRLLNLKYHEFDVEEPFLGNFFAPTLHIDSFQGSWDFTSLFDFFSAHKFPPFAIATSNFISYCVKDKKVKKFVLFQDSDNEPFYTNNLTKITSLFPGINFGKIDCKKNYKVCRLFGMLISFNKQLVIVEPKWNRYYRFQGDFNDSSVTLFIEKALKGKWPQEGPGAGFSGLFYNLKVYGSKYSKYVIGASITIVIMIICLLIYYCCCDSNDLDFDEEEDKKEKNDHENKLKIN